MMSELFKTIIKIALVILAAICLDRLLVWASNNGFWPFTYYGLIRNKALGVSVTEPVVVLSVKEMRKRFQEQNTQDKKTSSPKKEEPREEEPHEERTHPVKRTIRQVLTGQQSHIYLPSTEQINNFGKSIKD